MVRNSTPFVFRELRGADIEVFKDLDRVAIDDFSAKTFREPQRELALAGPGWSGHRNQRRVGLIR